MSEQSLRMLNLKLSAALLVHSCRPELARFPCADHTNRGRCFVATKVKIAAVLGLIVVIAIPLWQYAAWEFTNRELTSEVHYQTAQIAANIGLGEPKSDAQIRDALIVEFKDHGVDLEPSRVTVNRSGPQDNPIFDIDADYDAPIYFFGSTYMLHYHATGHTTAHWSPPGKLEH